jgi:drug/metabolite transporter (DMT)-like permease
MTALTSPADRSANALAGVAAMVVTLTMWSAFALSIRAMGQSALTPMDMALVRFVTPLVVLAPFIPSRWRALRRVRLAPALLIVVGAGLPFFMLAEAGAAKTSAAYIGSFIPGGAPIFVALAYVAFARRSASRATLIGLGLILCGALALIGPDLMAARPGAGEGAVLLLGAGALWAAYTIGLREAGLDPIGAAILLCAPSAAAALVAVGLGWAPSHMAAESLPSLAVFVAIQGLGVGVIASLAYVQAIRRLGPARSAAIGALSPALTALAAAPLLGERLTAPVAIGVALITAGVMLAQRQAAPAKQS